MKGAPYNSEDLERALNLAKVMTWAEVAAYFPGRTQQGIYGAAIKYKKGLWQPTGAHSSWASKNALCEELVEKGTTNLSAIAKCLGVTKQGAQYRLMRLGLDAEMRKAARHTPETQKPETGESDR